MARAISAAMRIDSASALSALVDPSVDPTSVRLHIGGLPGAYLRLVKKRAITIGQHIWFRDEAARDDRALVIHELVHVGQYRQMGVPRFIARYVRDLARARFRYSHDLPLEAPAYARQAEAKTFLAAQEPPPRSP